MKVSFGKIVSFCGMAKMAPRRRISCAEDAMAQWDILKHPQYTDIFQEEEKPTESEISKNQQIHEFNYGFLDELKNPSEMAKFIEYFKKVTGFPSLSAASKNMLAEFQRVLTLASYNTSIGPKDILLSGYDQFCSVGLETALPGSDLDKGYAIIRGVPGNLDAQKDFSDKFKGEIWENIDNRIMSVNHCAAFPNIMTDKELEFSIDRFEPYAKQVIGTDERYNLFLQERINNTNPVAAAKFNIWLSQLLNSQKDRVDAKNLAYIVETIRDGAQNIHDYSYWDRLNYQMSNSGFVWCSNLIQGHAMNNKYEYSSHDVKKPKLKARQEVEKTFDSWSVPKQYELVKDVIRSMSGDNKNAEFEDLFYSKADKHRLLINDILKGDVLCAFDFPQEGGEVLHFFPQTPETLKKYHNFDVYNRD